MTRARGEISLGDEGQTTTRKTAESTKGENTKTEAVTMIAEQSCHHLTKAESALTERNNGATTGGTRSSYGTVTPGAGRAQGHGTQPTEDESVEIQRLSKEMAKEVSSPLPVADAGPLLKLSTEQLRKPEAPYLLTRKQLRRNR